MDYSGLLVLHLQDFFYDGMKKLGAQVRYIWKNDHCSVRKWKLYKLLGKEEWALGFSKEDVKKAKCVLIRNHKYVDEIIALIRKWNKDIPIVWYLWDGADEELAVYIKNVKKIPRVKVVTYDSKDAEKFGIDFYAGTTSYYEMNQQEYEVKYDFICVMWDKNRIDRLAEIQKYLDSKCFFAYKFIVIKDKGKDYSKYKNIEIRDHFLPYEEIVKLDMQAKCIIDLLDARNSGLSARACEHLFYDKKLLTDNPNIVNCDFYNENNIFVLNDGNINQIADFMGRKFVPVAYEVKNRYMYDNWLKGLIGDEL